MQAIKERSFTPVHLNYLDGLRAAAALFVVLHHASTYTNLAALPVASWLKWPLGALAYGSYAVDLFIVLSGFCLMLPLVRGSNRKDLSAKEFFYRRARRILPTYYCALLLSAVLIILFLHKKTGTIWDNSIPLTFEGMFTHLILLQDAFGEEHTINYVLWSISVEWRIYFLFPLLALGWQRFGEGITVAVALVTSFALYLLCFKIFHATLSAHYIGLFALGMLGASISFTAHHPWQEKVNWCWVSLVTLLLVVLTSTWRIYRGRPVPPFISDYVVGFFSMSILIMVSKSAHNPLHLALSWKPIVFLGTFAYSIYLVHAPLLQIVWQVIPLSEYEPLTRFAMFVVLGGPIVLLGTYLFFLACERPFLRKALKPRLPQTI